MKTIYVNLLKVVVMLFVLFNITALNTANANEFNALASVSCEISKDHGQGFTTSIESVVDNCDGTHTIVLRVDHDGCSGPSCKELSNYSIEATPGTYSNMSVNVTSGGMTFSNIDNGPNLGAQIPFQGFKVDGISGIGGGMAGSFTVTYTLSGGLQDQQVSVKPGPNVLVETFTIADFESVMTCQGNTCATPDGPEANDDSNTTPYETPVDLDILDNDVAGDNPLDPSSVSFVPGTEPNAATEGVFTYNAGTELATFTPASGFSGTVTIDYEVCDTNALCDIATITVIVEPPTVIDNARISPILECVTTLGGGLYRAEFSYETHNTTDITIPVGSSNRFIGGGSTDQDRGQTTVFEYPAPNFPSNDRMGRAGFFPHNPFSVEFDGSSMTWSLTGPDGSTRTATASAGSLDCSTKFDGPTANDDSDTTPYETPVDLDILDNDEAGDNPLDPGSVAFVPGTEPNAATEGVFTYNAGTELATFTPASGFSGTVTIDYVVCDTIGLCDIATITVVVTPPASGPTAVDDSATTPYETPVDLDILDNDVAGDNPLDPSTVTFVAGTEPNAATEGVFTYNAGTELATFTPASGFSGTVTIDYEVCDTNAQCDIATITVQVDPPAGPINNFFPATGFGTLAYEDLWPSQGDYDFNDMVIDYQFEITSNAANFIEQVEATFVIKAFGASYQNGFGFQLSQAIDANDLTVTGHSITENYITLNGNGTEAGQARPTIIVFDNAYNEMPHPGGGAIGVNTENSASYVTPVTITVTIDFPANTYTWNQLNIANFNPFLISNMERGREVHLPGYQPTSLANASFFGQEDDATNLSQGKTYVNANNLPWAIHIYESFDYPIEKQDIVWVHLKFVEWAESGGTLFPNWYQNQSGYRNNALIYQQP